MGGPVSGSVQCSRVMQMTANDLSGPSHRSFRHAPCEGLLSNSEREGLSGGGDCPEGGRTTPHTHPRAKTPLGWREGRADRLMGS